MSPFHADADLGTEDVSFTLINTENQQLINSNEMGCYDPGLSDYFQLIIDAYNVPFGQCYWDVYYGFGTARVTFANAGWIGFTMGSCRPGAPLQDVYQANSVTPMWTPGSVSSSDGMPPNGHIYLFAVNDVTMPFDVGHSDKRLSFAAIADGFTQAEADLLYQNANATRVAMEEETFNEQTL